jgi:glycine/D-amino acid oxidase-like deaminating enzyme
MLTYDVVVVGSGIIGSLCAHALAGLEGSLLLLDRAGLCAGTSRASEGNLLAADRTDDLELTLMMSSLTRWRELDDELGGTFEFDSKGCLLVARDESQVDSLERHVGWLASRGVKCEVTRDAWKLEPNLSRAILAAGWFPDDAQVQPMLVCYQVAKHLVATGAHLRLYDGLSRIQRAGDALILELESGTRIHAGRVLICAGVFTPELVEPLGTRLPVIPRRGHIAVLERGVEVRRKVVDFSYNSTLAGDQDEGLGVQVAAVIESTRSGTILCGSSRQFAGFDRAVDLETVKRILLACSGLVPGLLELRVIRAYVGLRPFSPDGLPMIGWLDAERTVAVATGHEGSGHGLAAVTAELIRDLFVGRDSALHRAVDPLRFGAGPTWA